MKCPVCSSSDYNIAIARVWRSWSQVRKVVYCNNCGLYFLLNAPTEKEIRNHYEQYSTLLPLLRRMLKKVFRRYRCVSQYQYIKLWQACKPKSVLEVGTGEGILLDIYLRGGCAVLGVEYDSQARAHAFNVYGIPMTDHSFFAVNGNYDLVIMSHVLEHFNNPRVVLRHAGEILNRDGRLFIEVPCSPLAPAECSAEELEEYLQTDHVYNFRPANLRMLFEQEGYEIICLDRVCYNIPFTPGKRLRQRIGEILLKGSCPGLVTATFIGCYMAANLLKLQQPFRILESPDAPWQGQGDSIRIIAKKK